MKIRGGGEHCDIVVVVVVGRLVVVVVLVGLRGRLMALVLGGAMQILRSPVVPWRTWPPTCGGALVLVFGQYDGHQKQGHDH